MFELLLAYTFIGLFGGVVLFGHVLLIRDIFTAAFSSGSSTGMPARASETAVSENDMRKAA
jgi:hypothetical protein